MMKKALCFMFIILFLVGCTDDFSGNEYEQTYEKFKIDKNINTEFKEFFVVLKEYVDNYDKNMKLGSIQLNYDNQNNFLVYFDYYKTVHGESRSVTIHLEYDANENAIIFTDYIKGSSKICSPYEKELDISKWNINFNQGFLQLQEQMKIKGITDYKKIICYCMQNTWSYFVIAFNDKEYQISINPY